MKDITIGSMIRIGGIIVKVTQIGKTCYTVCNIKKLLGSCITPKKGYFWYHSKKWCYKG